jgi:hypothetical protein
MHDESYVQEILKAMPEGLSLEQFLARCAQDLAGGISKRWRRQPGDTLQIGTRWPPGSASPVDGDWRQVIKYSVILKSPKSSLQATLAGGLFFFAGTKVALLSDRLSCPIQLAREGPGGDRSGELDYVSVCAQAWGEGTRRPRG